MEDDDGYERDGSPVVERHPRGPAKARERALDEASEPSGAAAKPVSATMATWDREPEDETADRLEEQQRCSAHGKAVEQCASSRHPCPDRHLNQLLARGAAGRAFGGPAAPAVSAATTQMGYLDVPIPNSL